MDIVQLYRKTFFIGKMVSPVVRFDLKQNGYCQKWCCPKRSEPLCIRVVEQIRECSEQRIPPSQEYARPYSTYSGMTGVSCGVFFSI